MCGWQLGVAVCSGREGGRRESLGLSPGRGSVPANLIHSQVLLPTQLASHRSSAPQPLRPPHRPTIRSTQTGSQSSWWTSMLKEISFSTTSRLSGNQRPGDLPGLVLPVSRGTHLKAGRPHPSESSGVEPFST